MVLPDFAGWPLPVGDVRLCDGLLFVRSSRPGGFSAEDYREIPGKNRVELWDGVAVVHPKPDRRTAALARYFYELVEHARPDGVHPYPGVAGRPGPEGIDGRGLRPDPPVVGSSTTGSPSSPHAGHSGPPWIWTPLTLSRSTRRSRTRIPTVSIRHRL
jgi:hypothetical protein